VSSGGVRGRERVSRIYQYVARVDLAGLSIIQGLIALSSTPLLVRLQVAWPEAEVG